jgi:hypothetical protein
MGPEAIALMFSLAAVALVLAAGCLQVHWARQEAAEDMATAGRWLAAVELREAAVRRREYALRMRADRSPEWAR